MNTRREDQNLLKGASEERAYRSNLSIMQYTHRKRRRRKKERRRVNTYVYHMNESISLIYVSTGILLCLPYIICLFNLIGKKSNDIENRFDLD